MRNLVFFAGKLIIISLKQSFYITQRKKTYCNKPIKMRSDGDAEISVYVFMEVL